MNLTKKQLQEMIREAINEHMSDDNDPMDKLAHVGASAIWEKINVTDPDGDLYYSIKDHIKDILKAAL